MNTDSPRSNGQALRKIMRQVPYPVTIVTAAAGDRMRGITIGSFTSLSMEPPLVSFNVERNAQMHPVLADATHFAIHIPGPDQADLCDHFAEPDISGSLQFSDVGYTINNQGIPILNDAIGSLTCKKYDMIKAGDHSIVIGEVLGVDKIKNGDSGILYFNRAYHKIGARLKGRSSRIAD